MKEKLLLMRHLLDVQLVDAKGERMTKVDGVEVELRAGLRPVVNCLLVGPEPLARRIGPRIGRIVERITGGRREMRIPWKDVHDIGTEIRLRVTQPVTRIAWQERSSARFRVHDERALSA